MALNVKGELYRLCIFLVSVPELLIVIEDHDSVIASVETSTGFRGSVKAEIDLNAQIKMT